VEPWVAELQRSRFDAAWDLFLDRYRRLVFAAIRHYAQDYDDVMDVFARVCEALRKDDLRRLRVYVEQPQHSARFSTWLVTVVRHLTVDWFRQRDGRQRLSTVAEGLPPLQRRIFEHVFLHHKSHVEAYELIHASEAPALSFSEFLTELRATYRVVTNGRRGAVLRELGVPPPDDEAALQAPTGPSAADTCEQSQILERALGALGPDDRLIVELYVLEKVPAEAVARIVGLPNPKAVYNRVYRTLAVLREQLQRAGVRREDV
jgi:DNA-directed RNA polymerase specialized sigma24 family protein